MNSKEIRTRRRKSSSPKIKSFPAYSGEVLHKFRNFCEECGYDALKEPVVQEREVVDNIYF